MLIVSHEQALLRTGIMVQIAAKPQLPKLKFSKFLAQGAFFVPSIISRLRIEELDHLMPYRSS